MLTNSLLFVFRLDLLNHRAVDLELTILLVLCFFVILSDTMLFDGRHTVTTGNWINLLFVMISRVFFVSDHAV